MHSLMTTNPAGPPTMEGESVKPSPQPTAQAEDEEKNRRTVTVNAAHMGKAFKVMNELRSKRLLCDVMIVAEDVEVEAHRVVLAACSPYFCAMFTGDMSESKAKKIEIKQVADMNMCRRNAGVCAVNGLLYVVGGDDGSCNLASVEYYNPVTDKWTLLPTNMSTGRSYAGVAVIHKSL